MHNNQFKSLTRKVAAGTLIIAAPNMAFAQLMLEEVVVTAQKREQNVQDVPLSITAITGDFLAKNGVTDMSSLDVLTPGLQFGQSGSDARPSIRGARTENVSVQQDPVIGFFVDGIYRSRPSQALAAFVDVDRIEVLRGPQGTLFGRNTFGGAISLFSKPPEPDQSYGFDVTLGDYDHRRLEGFFNAPLTETVFARVSASIDQHDAYVENSFNSDAGLKDKDEDYFRLQLRWEPSNVFDATLRASKWTQGGNGGGDFGYFVAGTPAITDTAAGAINSPLLDSNPRTGGGNGRADANPYRIARDADASLDTEQETLDLELNWDVTFANLKVLLGYADFAVDRFTEGDLSPNRSSVESQSDTVETTTAEIQLSSYSDGPLEWTVGAFFLSDDARGIFAFDRLFLTDEATNTPDLTSPEPDLGDHDFADFASDAQVDTTSQAVYAQGTYALTDTFRVTLGARWSEDEKEFERVTAGDFSFFRPISENFVGRDITTDDDTFDSVTWRAGVELDLFDETLLYANASTGFQSGGFNNSAQDDGRISFDEQYVTAYEIGTKNRILGGAMSVNVSIFLNEFEDLLAQEFLTIGQTTTSISTNAGEATAIGIEGEIDWVPTDNMLLNFRASINDSEFGEYLANEPISGETIDLDGERIPLTPELTLGFNGQYDFDLGHGFVTPAISLYYSDDYSTNDVDYAFGQQDAYTKVDLRITYASSDAGWYIELFGKNVTDEEILNRTVRFGQNVIAQNYSAPATYGLRFGFKN